MGLCNLAVHACATSERSKVLRLVVIDNHELFREGLLRLLVMEGDFVPVGANTDEARYLIQHFWPDLILFGLGPVRERSIHLAQSLREEFPAIRLLLLDEAVRRRHLREALAMKAEGYWTKHVSFSNICAAMRQVTSGDRSFCPEAEIHLRHRAVGTPLSRSRGFQDCRSNAQSE